MLETGERGREGGRKSFAKRRYPSYRTHFVENANESTANTSISISDVHLCFLGKINELFTSSSSSAPLLVTISRWQNQIVI